MRTNAFITGTLSGLLLLATGAQAQTSPRMEGGFSVLGAASGGSFRDQVDGALGVGVDARLRLDAKDHFALRLDADWMSYGWDERNVDLRSPFGGVQSVELSSIHTISFVEIGPELSGSLLGVRPYVGASAGLGYFLTVASGDREDDGTRFLTEVEKHDLVFAYAGQTGVRIPVRAGKRTVSVELGARYQRSREAEFLRKSDLTVDESGAIHFSPVRAEAELWIFRAGVSVPLDVRKQAKDRD